METLIVNPCHDEYVENMPSFVCVCILNVLFVLFQCPMHLIISIKKKNIRLCFLQKEEKSNVEGAEAMR